MAIKTLTEFMETIEPGIPRERVTEVINWVQETYPQLELRIAWNQPMFTDHGTFIIGFSAAKKHMAMAPERHTMIHFESELKERGVDFGKMFIRQPWAKPFDYELAAKLIDYQIATKQDCQTFWRPNPKD
ncbi:hypothetical protein BSR29_07085 [Boudabousia liubingyangii]|uniref:YdhG-like domain-containing protein n=1 Tax=Boudabousia liubingyangii TaxID=1921764 RepID=A0A1Q5PK30_9ACTO|nr:DUF1801 domain-containing protein [Boudabousia liubingyangii]OKL46579.1 hypothetical protein BSR29_07085 [Boudabousia liubingyangii]